MSSLALNRFAPGGPAIRLDTTCGGARRGRIYWPTLYNHRGDEVGAASDNVVLEWRPACQRASDSRGADTWIGGSDNSGYAPTPPGSTQRPIPPPRIAQSLGPLWASSDGEVWIAGGNVGDPEVYVSLAWRAVHEYEPSTRTALTIWGTALTPIRRPRWAWGIGAPQEVTIELGYLNDTTSLFLTRVVTLAASGAPLNVNGAIQVTPRTTGPLTWEIAR